MDAPVGAEGGDSEGLQIVNIVASGMLGAGEIDTDVLGAELSCEKTVLPGRVYIKPGQDSPVAMVFRSGTYTVAGADSWDEVLDVVDWLVDVLSDVGLEINQEEVFETVTVKYMVVTGQLGSRLNLAAVTVALGLEWTEYEPEQFPAVIYRPEYVDCTVLLFSTGKMNITGVRNVDEADEVFTHIKGELADDSLI